MRFFNRVSVLTSTVGTGSLLLGVAATQNMLTLGEAGAVNGDETSYVIEQGADFEIGNGIVGSNGGTITRTTVHASKIGGVVGTANLNLNGTATVRFFPSAEVLSEVQNRAANAVSYSNGSSGLAATDVQAAIDALAAEISGLSTVAATGAFTDLNNKPTTLTGYGITDAASLSDIAAIPDAVAMAIIFGG